jgi:hypothetical protein
MSNQQLTATAMAQSQTIWLMMFQNTIAVYSKNHTEHINTLYWGNTGLLNIKASDIYSFYSALNGNKTKSLCIAYSPMIGSFFG